MNQFYELPKTLQWLLTICMTATLFWMIQFFYEVVGRTIWFLPALFILVPLGQFLFTPLMRLLRVYQYLSPMLLVYGASDKRYDLHNGTSFDYLWVMRKVQSGNPWRRLLLIYYLEGLLSIIDRIEAGDLPDTVEVRGSSYFFSDNTARRLGFDLHKTGISERLNLMINYLDLLWMYSMAHGKLTWPDLRQIKTAVTTGARLQAQKTVLQQLQSYLKKRQPIPC